MTFGIHDIVHPVDAASLLRLLAGQPRLLALGEPTHGEDALLELRNELFRSLVERKGYRTIALESDCLGGLLVDDYVATGAGALDEVMDRGFSHGFGASSANRDLVRWMRAYNDGRPPAQRVRFAGCDGPLEITHAASPRAALTALYAYLAARVDADLLPCPAEMLEELLGDDRRWTDPAAMLDPTHSVGQTPEAARLRLLADDLAALLDTQAPRLRASSSPQEWDRARLYRRTAVGLLRYHFCMADAGPGRMARLLGLRASMMADTLFAVAERGPALVYAHNAHLQRNPSTMRMGDESVRWRGAGAIVGERLGADYAFTAMALGTIGHRGVGAPAPDTVEGLLSTLPGDRCLVAGRRLADVLGEATPAARVSPWFGYSPLDPAQLPDIDALVFLADVPERQAWWAVGQP
jgi:erythromycin esterase-like protein